MRTLFDVRMQQLTLVDMRLIIGFIPSTISIRIRSILNYALNHSLELPEQLKHIHYDQSEVLH